LSEGSGSGLVVIGFGGIISNQEGTRLELVSSLYPFQQKRFFCSGWKALKDDEDKK